MTMDFARLANDMHLTTADALASNGRAVLAADHAYATTVGTDLDKMAAALRAACLVEVRPEPLLDLPDGWERLGKQELRNLVGDEVLLLWRHSVAEMRALIRSEQARRLAIVEAAAAAGPFGRAAVSVQD